MFVEKLSYEQMCQIAEKLKTPDLSKYQILDGRQPGIFFFDRKIGCFDIFLYDTCIFTKRYLGTSIEEKNKILVKELYKIFGEEYKEFYLSQANQIFEEN